MGERVNSLTRWITVGTVAFTATVHASTPAEPTDLESTIEALRREWRVPGAAVGVVRDGKLVFLHGFGLRDVEAGLPFTPATLVRVASTTKSITSALVGQFVDEGVVEWTTPVRENYPDFQMGDPAATAYTTFEDMLCHRTGLPVTENLLATSVGREWAGSPRG